MFNSFSYNIINAQKSDNIQLHSQTLDVISNQTKALENSSSIKVDNYPVAMILGSNNKIYIYIIMILILSLLLMEITIQLLKI